MVDAIVGNNATGLDYWNVDKRSWEPVRGMDFAPNAENMPKRVANGPYTNRVVPLFHEASTLYMTENFPDAHASVDRTYRPYGLHQRVSRVFYNSITQVSTTGASASDTRSGDRDGSDARSRTKTKRTQATSARASKKGDKRVWY